MSEHLPCWPEIHEHLNAGRPAILAIGSYEAHGPHLPVTTDTVIADAIATTLACRIGGLALPTLPFGATSRPRSGGGDIFPLPALRVPTLFAVINELVAGLARTGTRNLVVINGHYENAAVMWDALHEATQGTSMRTVLFDAPWELIDGPTLDSVFPSGVQWAADHGGLLETALMRLLAPEAVGNAPAAWDNTPRTYDVIPTPVDAVPANGIVNDARAVTAEDGARLFAALLDGLETAVRRELRIPFERT